MILNNAFAKQLLIKVWFSQDDVFEELASQTEDVFTSRQNDQIILALPDNQVESFDKLSSQEEVSNKKLYRFLVKHIPNFDQFMESLYDKFEHLYITKMKEQKNKSK